MKHTTTTRRKHTRPTINRAGGAAYSLGPHEALIQHILNGFYKEPNYYGSTEHAALEAFKKVAKVDPEFILKAAAYARNVANMRSMPIYFLVMAASEPACKPFIRKYTPKIVRRADQIAESLAMHRHYFSGPGKPMRLPNSLKKGLADSFENFDEYQLAKYNRQETITLGGALQLCHPKPSNPSRARLYKSILEGTLQPPETWEVHISTQGASKKTWEEIIPKMGYMALLRNLRNFLKHNVNMAPVLRRLMDPEEVRKSKQLPFRFWSAYRTVNDPATRKALERALKLSLVNLPKLSGRSAAFADTSGSMSSCISGSSSVRCLDIASLMCALFNAISEDAIIGAVATTAKLFHSHPENKVIRAAEQIASLNVGHGTDYATAIGLLRISRTYVDRILIFGDMQTYDLSYAEHWLNTTKEALRDYRKEINSNVHMYFFNLHSYGSIPVHHERNITHIAGWSTNVFKFLDVNERGAKTLVQEIQAYGA